MKVKQSFLQTATVFALLNLFSLPLMAQRTPIGNLLVEGVGEIPAAISERLDQYQNIRSASFSDWDASGKGLYISTRFADVAQIHHVSKAAAYREQITFFKEPVTSVSTCPDTGKDGFLYSRDIGGNEQFQIYFWDRTNGTSTLLTDGKSRNGSYRWNKKGDKIAFTSTKRTGKDLDFYIAPLNKPSDTKLILENKGGGWGIADWSDDESRLIVSNYTSANEGKMYLLDIASGKLEEINPNSKQISYGSAKFSKDGKGIFFTADEDSEFKTLRYYDLATKKIAKITDINHDVEGLELSEDGSKLVFVTNEGGYSKPYLMNTKTLKYTALVLGSSGVIGQIKFNKDNNRIAFSLSTPSQTAEVYVHDLKTKKTERWTYSETVGLNPASFSPAKLIAYPTFDKDEQTGKTRMIPSFLITPKNRNGKLPVLISIHGGPEGQSMASFNANNQYWANELGVAILVPNVRGSTGYGKTYLKLDNGVLRENSVKDIEALLDWITTQPNLDASRVAVIGGSYGGYMSLACMTNYNDRLKCGIDLFGISNFVSFLKNTSAYRVDLRRVEYGDERDPEMAAHLQKISPLTNIKKISKPMFIYQGENDPRVPLSESEQMVEALKQNGVSISYVRAKDEGHAIAKKANRDYTNAAMSWFLKKYLVEEESIILYNSINQDSKPNSTIQFNKLNAIPNQIDKNIRSIFQDRKGNYWFGTNGAGVYRYDKKILTQFTIKDGLADNQIINIQEDDLGNIWFGTGMFGISKFDGTKFTTPSNNAKITNGAETDWRSDTNDLWFYAGGGVFRYNNPSLDYLPFVPATPNAQTNLPFSLTRYGVYAILKDKKGNIWFGTQAEGVCKYDGKRLTWFKEKGLSGPAVLGLFEDSKGNLWFGNNGAGLFRYNGKTLTNFTAEKGLNNADFIASGKSGLGTMARIYAINEDNNGNIWIGTVDAGVWKYDGNNLTNYTTQDGLTSNAVNTIYKDRNGELWFGTDSNGICKFNGTTFTAFVVKTF